MLICHSCKHNIISKDHADKCTTVNMFSFVENTLDQLSEKPMMTYGLGGCTAIIIGVYKDDQLLKVIFGHHPDKNKIAYKLSSTISSNSTCQFKVLIKLPGEYRKKDNGYYGIFPTCTSKFSIFKNIDNISLNFEPYIIDDNEYCNKQLYLKYENEELKYTTPWGSYITL